MPLTLSLNFLLYALAMGNTPKLIDFMVDYKNGGQVATLSAFKPLFTLFTI